jgi:VWFA-related protein
MPFVKSFSVFTLWIAATFGVAQQTPTPVTQPPATVTPPDAQNPGQTESNQPLETLKVRANLVNLVFTVTDKNGHYIPNLQKKDFGLLDDGRPPAAVIAFTQQTNLPLRIGIMLDTSSSIRTRFKFEQDAAQDFFSQVVKPTLHDSAFIEGFDVQIALTQDYTANLALLDTGIFKLRPGGGTALYDSLYHTCQAQMLSLNETTDVRKVIILVSDGDDNYSRALESDAIKMCQRADTIVYTISTDTSPSRGKGGDVLQTIADATGGKAFFPSRIEEVSNNFREIEEELRSQYSLQYRPADLKLDGSFRTILLRAMNAKYKVRAKTGYFSPRP